jgi:hypothetical protein
LLIHLRGVSGAIDNDEHVFATLGYAPTNSIKIDADRILVDGKAPAVVHQWDRHELLREGRCNLHPTTAARMSNCQAGNSTSTTLLMR